MRGDKMSFFHSDALDLGVDYATVYWCEEGQ